MLAQGRLMSLVARQVVLESLGKTPHYHMPHQSQLYQGLAAAGLIPPPPSPAAMKPQRQSAQILLDHQPGPAPLVLSAGELASELICAASKCPPRDSLSIWPGVVEHGRPSTATLAADPPKWASAVKLISPVDTKFQRWVWQTRE